MLIVGHLRSTIIRQSTRIRGDDAVPAARALKRRSKIKAPAFGDGRGRRGRKGGREGFMLCCPLPFVLDHGWPTELLPVVHQRWFSSRSAYKKRAAARKPRKSFCPWSDYRVRRSCKIGRNVEVARMLYILRPRDSPRLAVSSAVRDAFNERGRFRSQ